jgi:hypothetical protein
MTRALMVSPRRREGALDRTRRAAHWALPRAAFLVESLAVAVGLFELVTFAMLQGNRLLAAHEWGLFLTHYAQAAAPTRAPVDLTLACMILALSAFVVACRFPAARLAWRVANPAEARPRGR